MCNSCELVGRGINVISATQSPEIINWRTFRVAIVVILNHFRSSCSADQCRENHVEDEGREQEGCLGMAIVRHERLSTDLPASPWCNQGRSSSASNGGAK